MLSSSEKLIRPPEWFFARNQAQADVVKAMQEQHREIDRLQERRFAEARGAALSLMAKTKQSWDSLGNDLITDSLRPGSPEAIARIRANKRKKRGIIASFLSLFPFCHEHAR
jgi:hypothetical protein